MRMTGTWDEAENTALTKLKLGLEPGSVGWNGRENPPNTSHN